MVRPDFAIFSAAFFVALLVVQRPTSIRSALRPLLLMVALPAAYQVFRMGYFAMLVPNTALAKEAGLSRWYQGYLYAWDTLGTYWLFVPFALLGAWLARHLFRRSRTDILLAVLPALAGAIHILYVIKVGGDFMHGRLILPGIFAMLMPVAALPLSPHRATAMLTAAGVVVWAAIAATELRTPYEWRSDHLIADEAWFYRDVSHNKHPVTLEDHAPNKWVGLGAEARRLAESGEAIVTDADKGFAAFPSRQGLPQPTVLLSGISIGLLGYAAGPKVHVVDQMSLADPIGSRFRLEARGQPGHEKQIDPSWAIARFSDPSRRPRDVEGSDLIAAAERALNCGTLDDVIPAITEPMSVSRFVDNLGLAPSATAARFAAQPDAAARELC
jgi:arabinofuranosyltransferase